ncbi:BamA/TamA family outer membrane protein [Cellulophaga omnivescoria]|uniref:translocation and assembly module lipoprotein TamL n=1 Tax=Cellulophaga omnivescoria TaxID=1888890 RepID=UPI003EBCBC2F
MKMCLRNTKHFAKISLLLLVIAITSCNALKKVEEDELLLTKNTITADGKKVKNEEAYTLISQKPNSNLLGYPLRLNLYNLAKDNPDSLYQVWLHKKPKRLERLNKLLSKKQVNGLGESFIVKGASQWLKNIGESPAIIDTTKTSKSAKLLKSYYDSKGYFDTKSFYQIDSSNRKQRAQINYKLELGDPYIIDSITKNITSKTLDSIYKLNAENSFLKEKEQYNSSNFYKERERLTNLFRNSGIFNFQESSIEYFIPSDSTKKPISKKMEVELQISNLKQRGQNKLTEYKIYKFDTINIYTDYFFGDDVSKMKSITYDNYTLFYKDKLKYKPKAITNAIFIKKDSVYKEINKSRTYKQINNLNTFKYPNITFDTLSNRLNTNIYLSPLKKYTLETNIEGTHSNIQRLGAALSTSLNIKNVFGGAETLSISARGSVGVLSEVNNPTENSVSEIGADVNLTVPRIWMPFKTKKIIPPYMLPQTRMVIGTNFQKNIGLDKQNFNTILGYNWSPTQFKKNSLELINIQFIRNLNPNRFYNVYQSTYKRLDDVADDYQDDPALSELFETSENDSDPKLIIPTGTSGFIDQVLNQGLISTSSDNYKEVRSIDEREKRLTENNLIFSTSFSYTKDSRKGVNDNDFHQFKIKVESAGNLLSLLSGVTDFKENEDGHKEIFGVPFSQYIKTDFDYIKHWSFPSQNVLAFRGFLGIAVPYGNSNSIPFAKSYFAGGSNDNRAWNAYSLGPGSTQSLNDFNEANLKIAANLEFRFPIAGSIKGAIFADAGNIWNVFDNEENEDAIFKDFNSLEEIALGTGFGLRYDFSYFVLRLDTGFKTYNPELEASKRWFNDYNFRNATINIGVNYPF